MKTKQTLRSRLQTRLAARFIPNPLRSGRIAVFVTAAALLLALSAPAATVVWNWTAGDRNWSTAGNWTGGIPASTNVVIFGNTDAQVDTNTVNTVDTSTTVSSLSYTNFSATTYTSFQNTTVASGQTLTITNGLNVGRGRSETAGGNVYTYASMTGAGGGVMVSGGNVGIADQGNSGAGSADQLNALLDLRGLAAFSYNNSAGTFRIAGNGQRRANGEVYFAGNNSITASAITLGYGGPAGIGSGPGKLHLGQTNALFADTITLGQRTTGSLIDFQTGLADPIVNIRARDGTSGVANWYLGWNSSPNQSASNGSGTNDFSGGILDASVTNLYLGYMNGGAPNGTRTAIGNFILGTNQNNSLVVQNLHVGVNSATSGGTGTASSSTGNFVVGGGTVTATAVTLAQPGFYVANGTLQLNTGAKMNVSGSITNGGGNTTSTISVSDATLNVGGVIGSPAANITTLNLSNATLGLTLTAPGSYSNAPVSVGLLNIDGLAGSTVIKINSTNASGQYPLIAYTAGPGGEIGFDGLSVLPAPGTTATLSNNVSSYPYTVDVVISASAELAFTTVPFTNTAGVLSSTITVQLQTGGGTPINTTSNLTVNLNTTSTGGVFRDLANTTDIPSVVISTGSSSASFLYRDTKAPATPTLTAAAPPYPPALQQETILVGAAAKLGFTPQPTNGFVSITLSPVVVQVQDAYGNPVPQSGTSVDLTLNGGTLDSGTTNQITDGNGQATFNDLLIMVPATGLTFSAVAAGPLTGTSSSFDVTYRMIVKAKSNTAMDTTTSWTGGVVPGINDIAVFNDSSVSTSTDTPDFGADASWRGIRVSGWTAGTGYGVFNSLGSTLTLGAGGYIGTNANHSMSWSNNFLLGTAQVWDWSGTGGLLTINGNIDNAGYLFTLGGSLAITVNGSINGAGNIVKPGTNTLTLNGTVAAGGSLTVSSGRLAGLGVIDRAVTIAGGAQIAPGPTTGTSATNMGTLTLSNSLTLNAGAEGVFRLNTTNAPATNDYLFVVGTQTINNSTITVTNRGPALVAGDSFALLSQPTAGFTTVNLPTGYTWTNKLAIDGTIQVLTVTPPTPAPTNITYTVNGSQLVMDWPAGQGWQLQAQTNTLGTGLGANWSTISGATPPYTNAIDPANPSVFYRLTYP